MKTIFCSILSVFLLAACSGDSTSPTAKTETFKVWGNCKMCKKTIETSLQSNKAVLKADWDVKSKVLTVQYDTTATSLSQIQQAIAGAGYDNEGFRGNDDAYSNLHKCCKYKRPMELPAAGV